MSDGQSAPVSIDLLVAQPLKVLFLVHGGVFAWWALLLIVQRCTSINAAHLLRLSYHPRDYIAQLSTATGELAATQAPSWVDCAMASKGAWRLYRHLLAVIAATAIVSAAIFTWSPQNVLLMPFAQMLPLAALMYTLYSMFGGLRPGMGITRLRTTFRRVIVGRINSSEMRTNDILLSDLLVLYSRVLNDAVMFVYTWYWDHSRYPAALELAVLVFPLVLRISQCWREYRLTERRSHLWNTAKYVSGILPPVLGFCAARYSDQAIIVLHLRGGSMLVNALYSLYWDIYMDWELRPELYVVSGSWRAERETHFSSVVYVLALVADAVLRFTWVAGFSRRWGPTLKGPFSIGYAGMEVAEILRRWVWCFLKLENDWSRVLQVDVELLDK